MATVIELRKKFNPSAIINHTLGVEAGYVDNQHDLGGKTRFGITERLAIAYKKLWDAYGFNGDMRTLPYELAFEIIRREFWNRLRLDAIWEISPVLAAKMLDWGVNAGTSAPVTALQEHLNAANRMAQDYEDMDADGIIGDETIGNLRKYFARRGRDGVRHLMTYLFAAQTVHYRDLTVKRERNEEFYNGWIDRVQNEQERVILLMLG